MADQSHFWSRFAGSYEKEFVDPYLPEVRSPLLATLQRLASPDRRVADLGCGTGPLLPWLAEQFGKVHAVDFAPGMLERARQRCAGFANVEFLQCSLTNLSALTSGVDVAVAVNSLVVPDLRDLAQCLQQIHALLQPAGRLVGIVPAMDGVHYHTMLMLERALTTGMPLDKARQNAAYHAEHEYYDFAFGEFRYQGLEQHFWQPFEVRYRLRRAGFRRVRLAKVHLSWKHFGSPKELLDQPPPWDWFFEAER